MKDHITTIKLPTTNRIQWSLLSVVKFQPKPWPLSTTTMIKHSNDTHNALLQAFIRHIPASNFQLKAVVWLRDYKITTTQKINQTKQI